MNPEELAEQVAKLADGCFTSLEPLQMYFLPLAKKLAARFSKSFPSRREDIYGTAYLAMCQLLKAIQTKEEEIPRSLPDKMAATIIWAIRDYVRRDHIIRWPRRATNGIVTYSICLGDSLLDSNEIEANKEFPEELIPDNRHTPTTLDIEDICRQFGAASSRDRKILILAIRRYTTEEIGRIIGTSSWPVKITLQRLKANYKKGKV